MSCHPSRPRPPSPMAAAILGCLLWLQQLMMTALATETVYFNNYGHCNRRGRPFDLKDDTYSMRSTGGPDAFDSSSCAMTFRASADESICLTFKEFNIEDCDVSLRIYSSKTASGERWRTLRCDEQKPNQMCTPNRYVTVVLHKESMSKHPGYSFVIDVGPSNSVTGDGVLFASIGVFVAIIVGVVIFIAVVAAVLIHCCYKRGRQAGGRKKGQSQEMERAAQEENLVQPSAPPVEESHDPPPPYVPPPPYEQEFSAGSCSAQPLETVYENMPMKR